MGIAQQVLPPANSLRNYNRDYKEKDTYSLNHTASDVIISVSSIDELAVFSSLVSHLTIGATLSRGLHYSLKVLEHCAKVVQPWHNAQEL